MLVGMVASSDDATITFTSRSKAEKNDVTKPDAEKHPCPTHISVFYLVSFINKIT